MLESSGHFIRAKLYAEQRAVEITKLQEILTNQAKEINDLTVENRTLK